MLISRKLTAITCAIACLLALDSAGQPKSPDEQVESDWTDGRWARTDIGPYLANSIVIDGETTNKGLAIKVGDQQEATICFDTDQLRYSGAWTGGFLRLSADRFGLIRKPEADGEVVFQTGDKTGWLPGGPARDMRPDARGPIPEKLGRYTGLHIHDDRVVLKYRLESFDVVESPWIETLDGISTITRDISIERLELPARNLLAEFPGGVPKEFNQAGQTIAYLEKDGRVIAAAVKGANVTPAAKDSGQLVLDIISRSYRMQLKIFIWSGPEEDLPKFAKLVAQSDGPKNLEPLMQGGPVRWSEPVTTTGSLGNDIGGFAIDTIELPSTNPWNALLFVGGHDFLPDGRAALCTVHGDVWIVEGIDEDLDALTWRRYATGLFHPLGLKVVGNDIYVLGRDQITIPRDLNGDGEADYYENFNNGFINVGGDHQYTTCLETDPAGNFYFLTCASDSPHGGCVMLVGADGKQIHVFATGFRNPNGMAIGPDGTITVADQQGNWVPETRLDVVGLGGFYGYFPAHKRATPPRWFNGPLTFIPRALDNSAGGQVWIPSDTWGNFENKLIHFSYGRCTMMLTLMDEAVPGQGGVTPLPGRFLSGAMRGRFNPKDGHLYVSGLNGWQTAAIRDGSLQRVRRVASPLNVPVGFSTHENGIKITFNGPLDATEAIDPENYTIEQWNYHWTAEYGSKDWRPSDPAKEGRDSVDVKASQLLDNRTVFLEIENLRPVMQMQIDYSLLSSAGDEMESTLALTTKSFGPVLELNQEPDAN